MDCHQAVTFTDALVILIYFITFNTLQRQLHTTIITGEATYLCVVLAKGGLSVGMNLVCYNQCVTGIITSLHPVAFAECDGSSMLAWNFVMLVPEIRLHF